MSPSYKVTYFDARGLAEPVRLIFALKGVEYEDKRVTKEEWPEIKANYPWGTLPVLNEDEKVLAQSSAMLRYLGKKFNLTGNDEFEAAKCDEMIEAMNDLRQAVFKSFYETDETKKAALTKTILEETFPKFLGISSSILEKNGGKYFVGSGITIADLVIASFLQIFNETYGDKNILEAFPHIVTHQQTIFSTPGIKEWIEKRPKTQW